MNRLALWAFLILTGAIVVGLSINRWLAKLERNAEEFRRKEKLRAAANPKGETFWYIATIALLLADLVALLWWASTMES